jgi:hemoglobin/transferrin/lactoferrin receptor protein
MTLNAPLLRVSRNSAGERILSIRYSSSTVRLVAGSALGLALAAVAQPAFAQDNDGDYWLARKNQIVVTATRIATNAADVPVTVTVKTDEQIADELVTDIRDLVRFEPGVSVQRQPANSPLTARG